MRKGQQKCDLRNNMLIMYWDPEDGPAMCFCITRDGE